MAEISVKDLFELTRRWNDISSIFTLACCMFALFSAPLASTWAAETSDSQDFELMHHTFQWSFVVAFTVAGLTLVDIICLLKLKDNKGGLQEMDSFVDSVLMCLTYMFLGVSYFVMAHYECVFVYIDNLAYGGRRPVFTVRYIQWCCCVPLLMCIGARQEKRVDVTETIDELIRHPEQLERPRTSFLEDFGQQLTSAVWDSPLAASIRLTVIYIGSSWLALVVLDDFARWLLICVSFSDYLIAALQEIALLLMRREDKSWTFSANLSAIQVVIYGIHGTIYLLAALGLISIPLEQFLYGIADVGAKLVHTIVLAATKKYAQSKDKGILINSAVNMAADVRRLIEDANVPIFSVNRNLEVIAWNQKITELTGRSSAETKGKPLGALAKEAGPTWNSSSMILILDALKGNCSSTTEIHFAQENCSETSENGTEEFISMALSATPLRDAYGEITGAVCVGQDVTELTLQRQRAQAIAAGLSRLIDEAAVPMFEVNLDMRLVDWNAWLVRRLDKSKSEALGLNLAQLLCSSCKDSVMECLAAVLQRSSLSGDTSECFEVVFEGVKLTLLMNCVPRTDAKGKPVSLVCVGQDVTRLKDVEEWKSSMMAMVSHELKSPLHGIIGLSHSMLEDRATENSARSALTMVNNSAKKLLDIVSGLMDTSRLLTKRELVRAGPDPVSLMHIIEDVVVLNRQSVDKRGMPCLRPGVNLVNKVKPPVPVIEGDAFRLTQLFYNLISNALKFTYQGTVTVSCVPDDIEKLLTVYVKDTGVGIAPENLERIFLPFDQEDHSEQRMFEGLGLGLAVCREVVVRHGGRLSVRSRKGQGATFRVQLPYRMRTQGDIHPLLNDDRFSESDGEEQALDQSAEVQTDLPRITAQGALSLATIPQEASKEIILSVDDDLVNQQVIKSLLHSTSYVFKAAVNGSEALNFMRENHLPALVLMEVAMPGLSGISVLKSLRSSYPPEILPVIIVSARSNAGTIIDCLKAGANDFVDKPFEQAELLWRMKLHLRVSKASRYPKGHNQRQILELFQGVAPQDLIQSLQAATSPNCPETTRDATKSKLERLFKSNQEKKESALAEAQATIESLQDQLQVTENNLKKAQLQVDNTPKMVGKHDLSLLNIQRRINMLEDEVKEREERLHRLKTLSQAHELQAESQHGLPVFSENHSAAITGQRFNLSEMVNDYEEMILRKEIRVCRLTENFGAGMEIRNLVQELKEEVLKLYQETRQKDQLLFDASFRLKLLSMTLAQKDIQLGICDSPGLGQTAPLPS